MEEFCLRTWFFGLFKLLSYISQKNHAAQDHAAQDHAAQDHTAQDHTAQDHVAQDHAAEDHAVLQHEPLIKTILHRCHTSQPYGGHFLS